MPHSAAQEVTKQISKPASNILYGVPEGHDARVLANKAREAAKSQEILIHVALDDGRSETLKDLLAFFAPDVDVIDFPAWDCLPYDRVSPSNDIAARRVSALTQLLAWQDDKKFLPRIVITTINAVLQRVTPSDVLKDASLIAQKGSRHLAQYVMMILYMLLLRKGVVIMVWIIGCHFSLKIKWQHCSIIQTKIK